MSAGYSGTPLPRKLGIKPQSRVVLVDAPEGFADHTLGALPEGAEIGDHATADVIVAFSISAADVERKVRTLRERMDPTAGLWIAWPKRASKIPTDVTEDVVRAIALENRLVDNKVCAIDATWSGLRLVIRVADRP